MYICICRDTWGYRGIEVQVLGCWFLTKERNRFNVHLVIAVLCLALSLGTMGHLSRVMGVYREVWAFRFGIPFVDVNLHKYNI